MKCDLCGRGLYCPKCGKRDSVSYGFIITPAMTSKGPEFWAGFPDREPFAVSEVSAEDAEAKAMTLLTARGWHPDMGYGIGMLLLAQYEQGRADQLEVTKVREDIVSAAVRFAAAFSLIEERSKETNPAALERKWINELFQSRRDLITITRKIN
jgi:hypothetical protein